MKQFSFLSIIFVVQSTYAIIWFDDGGVHDVNYVVTEPIQVWDDEVNSNPTTVYFLADFSASYSIEVFLNSFVNIEGGTFANVTSYNHSNLIISGGVSNNAVVSALLRDSSQGEISGGYLNAAYAVGDSKLFMTGGEIHDELLVNENGQVAIAGGDAGILDLRGQGKIIVHGTHFRINGDYVEVGEFSNSDFGNNGTLTCNYIMAIS